MPWQKKNRENWISAGSIGKESLKQSCEDNARGVKFLFHAGIFQLMFSALDREARHSSGPDTRQTILF